MTGHGLKIRLSTTIEPLRTLIIVRHPSSGNHERN